MFWLWVVTTLIVFSTIFTIIPKFLKKKKPIRKSLLNLPKTRPRIYSKKQQEEEDEEDEKIEPIQRTRNEYLKKQEFDINHSFYENNEEGETPKRIPIKKVEPVQKVVPQPQQQQYQQNYVKTPQKYQVQPKQDTPKPPPQQQQDRRRESTVVMTTPLNKKNQERISTPQLQQQNKKREREFDFSTPKTQKEIKKSGTKRDRKERTPGSTEKISEKKIKLSEKEQQQQGGQSSLPIVEIERVQNFETPKKTKRIQFSTPKSLIKKGLFTHEEDIKAHNERVNEILSSNIQQQVN